MQVPAIQLVELLETAIKSMVLTMPRSLACLSLLPFFTQAVLTAPLRRGVAFAIALPIAGGVYAELPRDPIGFIPGGVLVFKEVMIGFFLGLLIALPFWAMQNIGGLIDNQRGANAMQQNDPSKPADASILGALVQQSSIILLIQLGGFVGVFKILLDSYALWPVLELSLPLDPVRRDLVIDRAAYMMYITALYTAPIVICLLMVEFGFALASTYVPNIQISQQSQPIKNVFSFFVFAAYSSNFWYLAGGEFSHLVDLPKLLGMDLSLLGAPP